MSKLNSLTLVYSASRSPSTNGPKQKTSKAMLNLCKWARRISTRSGGLQYFEILRDTDEDDQGDGYGVEAPPRVDDFVGGHLARRHSSTLRSLVIPDCYISRKVFYNLLDSCPHLEILKLTIRIETFVS